MNRQKSKSTEYDERRYKSKYPIGHYEMETPENVVVDSWHCGIIPNYKDRIYYVFIAKYKEKLYLIRDPDITVNFKNGAIGRVKVSKLAEVSQLGIDEEKEFGHVFEQK